MITAPNLSELEWLIHGFGTRDTQYPPAIVTVRQIHSCIVLEAEELSEGGSEGGEGDALICREPGTVVGVRTADCVPVLIADPVTKAVAAIHAGWRGTAGNIVAAAVARLCRDAAVLPQNLRAAVGPSIGPCCYETGPEVAQQFAPEFQSGTTTSGTAHLDLRSANEKQLRDAGIISIWKAGECTFCTSDYEGSRYYSFRRERENAGRMISYIGIK